MTRHTIEASEKPVVDIFCDKYVFRIPSYQRPYAWTTEQVGELLDDIRTACGDTDKPEDQSPYFLGSIVLIKDPQKPDADVVDGQQRLTTLTILMSVLRDLADPHMAGFIHRHVCQDGNPITGAPDVFRLTPRERDADFFRTTIQTQGQTLDLPQVEGLKDAKARMVENAAFLRQKLSALSAEERRRLTVFIANRCYLVVVAASDQESAFRIFSVMNSRGLDLSAADILKADIIGKLPTDQQEKYTGIWETAEEELGRERFADGSPLQLTNDEKIQVRQTLNGDIYTVTRIRLPLLLRLDELLSQGSATYAHAVNSVEHVLPQNPKPDSIWSQHFPTEADRLKWVHKLANLVLLTRRKNAQASNYDFAEKKQKYFSTTAGVSNYALTSQVLSEPVWTEEVLVRRQADLIAAIEKLWRLA